MASKRKFHPVSIVLEKRLLAVEIVERMGGQISEAALNEVRRVLELPDLDRANLRRWIWAYKNTKRRALPTTDRGRVVIPREAYVEVDGTMTIYEPNDHKIAIIDENNDFKKINVTKLADEARSKADKLYAEIAEKYLTEVLKPEKMQYTSAKEAAHIATMAYDRIVRRTTELPEALATIIPLIVQALTRRGLDPYTVFYSMLTNLKEAENEDEKKSMQNSPEGDSP